MIECTELDDTDSIQLAQPTLYSISVAVRNLTLWTKEFAYGYQPLTGKWKKGQRWCVGL